MAKSTLFTCGYSGYSPESFLEALGASGVEVVVDVRQNPVSRKRGFSKTALAASLTAGGLEYLHVREMGVPAPLRQKLRAGELTLPAYLAAFRRHLHTQAEPLARLAALALRKRCCLLCVEHAPQECHRSVVAELVVAASPRQLDVVNL